MPSTSIGLYSLPFYAASLLRASMSLTDERLRARHLGRDEIRIPEASAPVAPCESSTVVEAVDGNTTFLDAET